MGASGADCLHGNVKSVGDVIYSQEGAGGTPSRRHWFRGGHGHRLRRSRVLGGVRPINGV